MENLPLFNTNGKLNPSITILGNNLLIDNSLNNYLNKEKKSYIYIFTFYISGTSVRLAAEKIVLNSIVLPHKELTRNFKNEIIL